MLYSNNSKTKIPYKGGWVVLMLICFLFTNFIQGVSADPAYFPFFAILFFFLPAPSSNSDTIWHTHSWRLLNLTKSSSVVPASSNGGLSASFNGTLNAESVSQCESIKWDSNWHPSHHQPASLPSMLLLPRVFV